MCSHVELTKVIWNKVPKTKFLNFDVTVMVTSDEDRVDADLVLNARYSPEIAIVTLLRTVADAPKKGQMKTFSLEVLPPEYANYEELQVLYEGESDVAPVVVLDKVSADQ